MDEKEKEKQPEDSYTPRPWWQIAGAWVGLALFIFSAVLLYLFVLRLY